MVVLSDRDIASHASLRLSDENKTKIATAIALAESSGNTQAHNNNPSTRDDSYGLWQINMYGSLGPSRRRSLEITSNTALYDPVVNAKAMAQISSNGTNWNPWSVYTNGRYKQYLERAEEAAKGLTGTVGNPIDDIIESVNPLSAFQSLIEPLQKMFKIVFDAAIWVGNPNNWIRILQVGGGVTLAIVAASIVAKPTLEKLPAADVIRKKIPL